MRTRGEGEGSDARILNHDSRMADLRPGRVLEVVGVEWDRMRFTHISRATAAVGDVFVFWGVMSCHVDWIVKRIGARRISNSVCWNHANSKTCI